MPQLHPHRFGGAERLKSRKEIQALFTSGSSFFMHPFKVIWQIKPFDPANNSSSRVQVGVVASSRNFKKAVDRNHIKRLMREAYRLQKTDLWLTMVANNRAIQVFFIFTDKSLPKFEGVHQKMGECLQRLIKKTEINKP